MIFIINVKQNSPENLLWCSIITSDMLHFHCSHITYCLKWDQLVHIWAWALPVLSEFHTCGDRPFCTTSHDTKFSGVNLYKSQCRTSSCLVNIMFSWCQVGTEMVKWLYWELYKIQLPAAQSKEVVKIYYWSISNPWERIPGPAWGPLSIHSQRAVITQNFNGCFGEKWSIAVSYSEK